jgi:hypothetical protein
MTAPTQSPLVWRVAEALAEHERCRLCEGSDTHCNHHRELAQKALDACHVEEMRDILRRLTAPYTGDPEAESLDAIIEDGRAILAKLGSGAA